MTQPKARNLRRVLPRILCVGLMVHGAAASAAPPAAPGSLSPSQLAAERAYRSAGIPWTRAEVYALTGRFQSEAEQTIERAMRSFDVGSFRRALPEIRNLVAQRRYSEAKSALAPYWRQLQEIGRVPAGFTDAPRRDWDLGGSVPYDDLVKRRYAVNACCLEAAAHFGDSTSASILPALIAASKLCTSISDQPGLVPLIEWNHCVRILLTAAADAETKSKNRIGIARTLGRFYRKPNVRLAVVGELYVITALLRNADTAASGAGRPMLKTRGPRRSSWPVGHPERRDFAFWLATAPRILRILDSSPDDLKGVAVRIRRLVSPSDPRSGPREATLMIDSISEVLQLTAETERRQIAFARSSGRIRPGRQDALRRTR